MSSRIIQGNQSINSEYKKIFCAYHSTQFLTNFCLQKQCLMPLCPSCVAEHTEEHFQSQQKPTYINLNESLHDIRQQCYAHIVSLQDLNRKNIEISNYIVGLPQYIHRKINQCKQQVYVNIQQIFTKYEQKILQEIQQHYNEQQIYNKNQCENLSSYIMEQIEQLYEKIAILKSQQCLSALIRYYSSDGESYREGINDVNAYIARNKQAGGLLIQINEKQLQNTLENFCQKCIVMMHISEEEILAQQNLQNQNLSKRKGNMNNSQFIKKINRHKNKNSSLYYNKIDYNQRDLKSKSQNY